jgi:hypothetical protein
MRVDETEVVTMSGAAPVTVTNSIKSAPSPAKPLKRVGPAAGRGGAHAGAIKRQTE